MPTKDVEFLTYGGDKFMLKNIPFEAIVELTSTEISGDKAKGLQVKMPDGTVLAYISSVQSFVQSTLTMEKLTASKNFV